MNNHVVMVTPVTPNSKRGNRVTAYRWARIMEQLGWRVSVCREYEGEACDLMIALHATKSFSSIERYREVYSQQALIVGMAGTDLYGLNVDVAKRQRAYELANRLVLLQEEALNELPPNIQPKAKVIVQSAIPLTNPPPKKKRGFNFCVLSHLRPVKDPFRAALALKLLPQTSKAKVIHAGKSLSEEMTVRVREEMASNHRYVWVDELPRWKGRRLLAQSQVLIHASISEGGANVISETIAAGVPVLASRIPGNVGLLGKDYPGFFQVSHHHGLAQLMNRVETDRLFFDSLKDYINQLKPMVEPRKELNDWRQLLIGLEAFA